MLDTMTRWLEGIQPTSNALNLRKVLTPCVNSLSSEALTSAGLVVSTTGAGITAKTGGSIFYALVRGSLVSIAAGTDMPALTGINIDAGFYNVVCFYVDSSGATTAVPGTEGATMGAVKFPQPPPNKALIGFLLITYASQFVGGTTPLATATTVYFSPTGSFDATALV